MADITQEGSRPRRDPMGQLILSPLAAALVARFKQHASIEFHSDEIGDLDDSVVSSLSSGITGDPLYSEVIITL